MTNPLGVMHGLNLWGPRWRSSIEVLPIIYQLYVWSASPLFKSLLYTISLYRDTPFAVGSRADVGHPTHSPCARFGEFPDGCLLCGFGGWSMRAHARAEQARDYP